MDIYKIIFTYLRDEYEKGLTYQDIADKYGVSYTHIHNLLNGKRPVEGMSIDFFFKIFPHLQKSISDSIVAQTVNGGNMRGGDGAVLVGSAGSVVQHAATASDIESVKAAYHKEIMNRILTCDKIPAEIKVQIIQLLL